MAITKQSFGQKELRALVAAGITAILAIVCAVIAFLGNIAFLIPMVIFIICALVFIGYYLFVAVKKPKQETKPQKKEEPKTTVSTTAAKT